MEMTSKEGVMEGGIKNHQTEDQIEKSMTMEMVSTEDPNEEDLKIQEEVKTK